MAQLLLDEATATGAGPSWNERDTNANSTYVFHTFQAVGATTSSTGAATVLIQVSNDGVNYLTLGTITLTLGTALTSDGFAAINNWNFYRANVSAISGTGANVSVYMKG
jgi:hypothetical protein